MARSDRLLALIGLLRRHRLPVSGQRLATDLGISLRTLYRDIASLQGLGADIAGEPGVGYVLRPGFLLPPLMMSEEEIEALTLGARFVAKHGDPRLAEAAGAALAKITAVLPDDLRDTVGNVPLLVGPTASPAATIDEGVLRLAIRRERKVRLRYRDAAGQSSERLVWPFALGFFDHVRVLVAWCELRAAFRHFRADRIAGLEITEDRYPKRRAALLKAWREVEGVHGGTDQATDRN